MGTTKAKWNNGVQTFFDGSTFETVHPMAGEYFYDDFLNLYVNTAAAGYEGWTKKDISVAGTTVEAIVANQHGGVMQLALDATGEEQEAGVTWGNAKNFNLDKGPIFETRVAAKTLPTLLAECYFGMAGDYVKGTLAAADNGPTIHACFMLDGSGAVTIHTDDTALDNNAIATGITVLAEAYHIYRIDFTNVADVKFYIDGVSVATGTTFNMSTGSNVMVQPYLMNYKSAGAGLGDMYYDYVRAWCTR